MTLTEKHGKKFQELYDEIGEDISVYIKRVAELFALQKWEHRKQKEFIKEFLTGKGVYVQHNE